MTGLSVETKAKELELSSVAVFHSSHFFTVLETRALMLTIPHSLPFELIGS